MARSTPRHLRLPAFLDAESIYTLHNSLSGCRFDANRDPMKQAREPVAEIPPWPALKLGYSELRGIQLSFPVCPLDWVIIHILGHPTSDPNPSFLPHVRQATSSREPPDAISRRDRCHLKPPADLGSPK